MPGMVYTISVRFSELLTADANDAPNEEARSVLSRAVDASTQRNASLWGYFSTSMLDYKAPPLTPPPPLASILKTSTPSHPNTNS